MQNTAWDTATSLRAAKHAAAHGANNGWDQSEDAILDYYKTIGATIDLPLIMQTRDTMSVDFMVRIFREIPTNKVTKEEVGNPLEGAPELNQAHHIVPGRDSNAFGMCIARRTRV